MGHQEPDFRHFPVPEDHSTKTAPVKSEGAAVAAACNRDNLPVVGGGKRSFGVPLEQQLIMAYSGVPRVVARLCHYIERHGMQTKRLFNIPSNPRHANHRSIAKMRADFDTYGECNLERIKDVAAAAGCLKLFLRELPEAVVPSRYMADFEKTLHEEYTLAYRCERLSTLVHSLPTPHYALLRFMCSFLRRVTNFHSATHMSAETLGIVFGPNIFRVPDGEGGAPSCMRQQAAATRLLTQLIRDYDRIFNALGQRPRPTSGRSDRSDGPASGDRTSARTLESDGSASSGLIKKRVDKSIHDAVTSHLLATVNNAGGNDDEAGDRSGEPPCKRLEGERPSFQATGRPSRLTERRSSHQPWPVGRGSDCVRRASSHDDISSHGDDYPANTHHRHSASSSGTHHTRHSHHHHHQTRTQSPAGGVARSKSAHQVTLESQPITVPSSQGYDLPTPWSPVYTDDVIESPSSSSSSSECGETPPALQEIMCRHEQQRQSERFAAFPRSRDKTSRSRDVRRRRHSRGDGKDPMRSRSPAEGDDEYEEEEEEEDELSDGEAIPPLDLDGMGCEPVSSTVLKGRQLTEDEVILSPRNSFALPDAEFLAEQQKLCSRFNERPPVSGSPCPAEPRSQQLRQTIASAKRRLRSYEEQFETRHGYRPSHADRQKDRDMQRWLSELSRARKELKQLKQDHLPAASGNASSTAGRQEKENLTPETMLMDTGSLEQTVAAVTQRLSENRHNAGRPMSPEAMSREQVMAEKLALQKALLNLEQKHGRPDKKQDRDLVRPLYERYRLIKRLSVKSGSPKLRDSIGELTPILEHETMSFTTADRPAISEREDELEVTGRTTTDADGADRLQLDDNLHNLPVSQLRDLLSKAKDDKRRLRDTLLVFEEEFRSNVGRKVQKDDRGDMDDEYAKYKQIKAKVKLLEVLVAKHRSRSFTM